MPLSPDLSDESLVHRCRAGDQAAWVALVERFQRLVYTVPRRMGLGDADAADVFQHVFARLFESLARIDDPARVRAWLVTTARRESLRLVGERSRVVDRVCALDGENEPTDPLDSLPDPDPLPEDQLAALQDEDRLRRALGLLDERARSFLELLFLQDPPLSYSEIATRMGISEGSIGPTRARCLDKLRSQLALVR